MRAKKTARSNGARVAWRTLVVGLVLLGAGAWECEAASPAQPALDRGTALYQDGKYAEAAHAFEEATHKDAGYLKAWENLGWAYLRLGRDGEAADVWETVLKVEPDHPKLAFEVGMIRLAQGKWDSALVHLQQGLRDPDRERIQGAGAAGLADALISEGVPADTARRYQERAGRVQGLAPLLREHYGRRASERGQRAYRAHNYRGAASAYEAAVRWRSDHVQSWIDLGASRHHAGDLKQAAGAWERAAALIPSDERTWRGLAEVRHEQGDRREARRLYEKVWKMKDGRQPEVAFHLAQIAFEERSEARAFEWLSALIELEDADGSWGGRMATLLIEHERMERGLGFLEPRAKARNALVPRAALARLHAERGRAAQEAGRMEEARAAYARALDYAPDDGATLRDLGWALWKADDLDGCEQVWRRYLRIAPSSPQPHDLLAQLHLRYRRYDDAIAELRTSLKLDSDQPATEVRLVQALYAKGEYKEARSRASRLARRYPDHLNAQIVWGEILIAYHDFVEGRQQWLHVLELDPQNERGRYYVLRALYEQGQQDEAVAQAREDLKAHGPHEQILRLLAEDAMARDDSGDAERWLKEITKEYPERLAGWTDLARLHRNEGRMRAAWNVLDAAQKHHPESLELRSLRLDAMRFVQPERGYKEYRELAEAQPDNRDVFWGRFESALRTGRSEEAFELLRTYGQSRMKPQDYEVEISRALFAMGKYGESERTIRHLVESERGQRHVPILLYHGLATKKRSLSISQEEFRAHMEALHKAKYTALTVSELARIARGRGKLPARPILITFDDARRDSFDLADPILRKYGLKATMFVPTARILDDGPFFADWSTIRKYSKTGRWDMQSHGHRAHDQIVTNTSGDTEMFLTNREWSDELGRLETFEEYEARVADDYATSVKLLQNNVPGVSVAGFAYPYSEAGQQTLANEPQALEVNRRLTDRHFELGFVQDEAGYTRWEPKKGDGARWMWRLTVPRGWSGQRLLQHLAEQHPVNRAQAEMALLLARADRHEAARTVWADAMREEPLLRARGEYQLALLSSQQGDYRTAERHLQAARAMGLDLRPSMRGPVDRIDWESGIRVIPRVRSIQESGDRSASQQFLEVRAQVGDNWDLAARGGQVRYVQGDRSAEGYELGADMVRWLQRLRVEGGVTRRWGPQLTDSLQVFGDARYVADRIEARVRAGRDDVETFGGRDLGIQASSLRGGALVRLNPRLRVFVEAGLREYDDGVRRRDYLGRLRVELTRSFELGVEGSSQDCEGESDRYYTPQDLRQLTGLLGYHKTWDFGLRFEAEAGVGAGRDVVRQRLTGQGRVRAIQELSSHVRGEITGAYSRSPSYERFDVLANIGVSF